MPTTLPQGKTWQMLAEHYESLKHVRLIELFTEDPDRARRFAIELGPLYLDFSKNHITDETIRLFAELAHDNGLYESIDLLYSGAAINRSENRAALHTALRGTDNNPFIDPDISAAVASELDRMTTLHERLKTGWLTGFTGQSINTIVNIGIGGSELGPRLLTEAFSSNGNAQFQVHFVANMDPADIDQTLQHCDAETTLFIISSKSFTTLETRYNFAIARDWLDRAGCPGDESWRHFCAATANPDAAMQMGVAANHIFRFWDWVGGRYSVWSAAGLAALLAIGPERFRTFLAGGEQIDRHFRETPVETNIPAMLALISNWYVNLHNCQTQAIVPYDQRLSHLPGYLCQLAMESTGKSTTNDGRSVTWQTGPAILGGMGTNAQHSFFQALHQGTQIVPIDFLVGLRNSHNIDNQHDELFINCLAQSRALMTGNENTEPHKQYPGNRPSNTLLYDSLSPEVLGAILAIYEHKTFVQALLWQINPFDQWGVELGKSIARELGGYLRSETLIDDEYDSSTRTLLERFRGQQK